MVRLINTSFKLERESYAILLFYVLHLWVGTNKTYIALLILLGIYIYKKSKSFRTTAWIALVVTVPFQQAKYFVSYFFSTTHQNVVTPVIYSVSYTDVLLLTMLYALWRDKNTLRKYMTTPADLCLIPLLCISSISTYFSPYFTIAAFGALQFFKLVLLYLVSRIQLRHRLLIKITLEAIVLFVLLNSFLIVLQKVHGGPLGLVAENLNTWSIFGRYAGESVSFYRPAGITDDPNASATILGMFIPFLLILAHESVLLSPGLIWSTLIIAAAALLFTGSRAVWGTTSISSIVTVWILWKYIHPAISTFKRKLIIVAVVIGLSLSTPSIVIRLQTLGSALADFGSATYRLRHARIGFDIIRSNPFGIGLNTTAYEMSIKYNPTYYMYDPSELHNIFAQVASGIGIFGLLSFTLFLYITIVKRKIINNDRRASIMRLAIVSLLVSYILASNFYPWLLTVSVSGYFWIIAALHYEYTL
jgi:hypothetical protein